MERLSFSQGVSLLVFVCLMIEALEVDDELVGVDGGILRLIMREKVIVLVE
jgi:hypothetical protein